MKAKRLETILGTELAIGEAEMVQRFQKLRDMNLLPVSRGRNAEDITRDAIVSGLLSVIAERPGFAAMTATNSAVSGPWAGRRLRSPRPRHLQKRCVLRLTIKRC